MSPPFRIAIVGTGKVAQNAHLPAALAASGVEVVSLVDPELERARSVAERFDLRTRCVRDVSEVLEAIDGAVIATPNQTHCEVALSCLHAHVPVLVEKPLTTTLEDAQTIVAAAEAAGLVVAVGYTSRFQENVLLFRELLDEGHFGAPLRFYYQAGTAGGWTPMSGYNLNRTTAGGGVTVVTGTHFLDRMLWWFGYPNGLEYRDDSIGGPEANAEARFHYEREGNPFEGTVRFSKTVSLQAGFVMEAECGTVILHEDPGAELLHRPLDRPEIQTVIQRRGEPRYPPDKDRFLSQLEDFVRACSENGAPMVSARDGMESVRLIEELYRNRTPLRTDAYDAEGC